MAADQSSSSGNGGSRKPPGRGKRKPVTIDLTAKDVTLEVDGETPSAGKGAPASKAEETVNRNPSADAKKATPETAKASPNVGAEKPAPTDGNAKPDAGSSTAADASSEKASSKEASPKEALPKEALQSDAGEPEAGQRANQTRENNTDSKNTMTEKSGEPAGSNESAAPGSDQKPSASADSKADDRETADNKKADSKSGNEKPDSAEKPTPAEKQPSSETPILAAAPPPAKKGVGFFGVLAASILGALLVVGALVGLSIGGLIPIGSTSEMNDLNDALSEARNEIAILETRLDETEEVAAENARSVIGADTLDDRLILAEEALEGLVSSTQAAQGALKQNTATVESLARAREAQGETTAAIEARQKTMIARLNGLEEASGADIRNLNQVARNVAQSGERLDRVEALQTDLLDLRKLVETGAVGSDVALASLEDSINGLRTRVDALAKASSTAVTDARLAALEAASGGVDVVARRLGSLEAEVDTMTTRVDQAVRSISPESPQIDEAITKAFANLEPRFSSLSAELAATAGKVGQLRADAATLQERLQSGERKLAESSDGLSGKFEGLASEIGKTSDTLGGNLTALASRMDALEAEINKPGALDQAALAVAATRLKDAVDDGRPFATELAAVRALVGEDMDLSALQDRAKEGLAEEKTLLAAFPENAMRKALMPAAAPTEASDDPVDQVLTGLRSLVRIKSLEKDNPDLAALNTITNAVKASDLKAALAAWQTLPEPAKTISATWAGNVSARLSIDAIVEKVTDDVVKSLSNKPATTN